MYLRKKRTVVHTIRMEEDLEESLLKESESKHVTFNSLVNTILYRHTEFDSYADRFGFITITKSTFQAIVSEITEEQLEMIARDISALAMKEFTYFKYKEPGLKAFLDFISILCNYGGLGNYELKSEGLDQRITIRHNLGRKVSLLFGMIFRETIRLTLQIEPTIQNKSENEIVISFTANPFLL